jgi:hypothetical protein
LASQTVLHVQGHTAEDGAEPTLSGALEWILLGAVTVVVHTIRTKLVKTFFEWRMACTAFSVVQVTIPSCSLPVANLALLNPD